MKDKFLIIIPAYNEQEAILQTVNKLMHNDNFDYIVINDGSTDNTDQILKKNNIKHVTLPFNLGIGGAMQTGYIYALINNYDYAIQLDADGQHKPEELEILIQEMKTSKVDMVIGSRFVEKSNYKGSLIRRIGIYYFYYMLLIIARIKINDPTSGYRIVNKNIIKEFAQSYPVDYPEVEVLVQLARKNYQIKEVKVEMNARQGGTSSITPIKSIYYMLKVTYFSIIQSVF